MFQLSQKSIQSIKLILHTTFVFFIIFALLRRAFLSIPNDWLFFLTSSAVENFVCALIAYILHEYVFKSNYNWKRTALITFSIIALVILASLKDYRIHNETAFEQTFEYFTSFLGQTLLFYAFIFIINRLEFFGRYQKLEEELRRANEQLLRDQLHPHFLFNAFNSLYSLSLKNHPETSDYILKLSGMMRYLTDETHLQKVPLHREIDFIEKYIAIEKIRFGKAARIKLNVEYYNENEKWIEPFLLITLVENAFKHGFYTNLKDAFITINLNIGNTELLCYIENSLFTKQHFQEINREGKGLENLRKRLQLLYPKSSSLKITKTETTFNAHLKITFP